MVMYVLEGYHPTTEKLFIALELTLDQASRIKLLAGLISLDDVTGEHPVELFLTVYQDSD